MFNLEQIAEALYEISTISGTNAKKIILKRCLNDPALSEDFEKVLKHLYDPMVTTGISKTSWNKAQTREFMGLSTVSEILDYLHKNNSGKLETVETMKSVCDCMKTFAAKQLIYWLTTKDINIGISRGTVEKYVHIPKFEIMLGIRPDYDDIDWNREFILTQKLDGVNLTAFVEDGKVRFLTRQGKTVEGLTNLEEEYKKMPDGVYFGEALYSERCDDRKELYRLTTGEITSKRENKKIKHYLFDYVSLKEWNDGIFIKTYQQTIAYILDLMIKMHRNNNNTYIDSVPVVYKGNSREKAMALLNEAKENDEEGLVLRYCSSVYEQKRSDNFVKLKPYVEGDYRIIGYKEYKHPNMLGAFIVEYKNGQASVGSGYTLEDREKFWKIKDEMVGKIITVQSMEESQDSSGKKSLRFPVFIRVRDDKIEPSYN